MSDWMEEQMFEMGNPPDDKTCWVCGKEFSTEEEHDTHYEKCADMNVKTEYSKKEAYGLLYNKY